MSSTTYHLHEEAQDLSPAPGIDPSPRLLSLDVLWGIAVLGALFTSIWIFGGFSENQQTGFLTGPKGGNYILFSVIIILLEGKMSALIAMVFGAGMLLYLFKGAQRKLLQHSDAFIRRQLWLILFGLINAFVFLWSGDLLFHLGIMGVLLFPFIRLSPRGLLIAAILAMLILCGKNYWRYADDHKMYNKYLAVVAVEKKIQKDSAAKAHKIIAGTNTGKDTAVNKQQKDTLTKKQKGEKGAWEGLVKGMKYDPKKDEEHNKAVREVSYGKIWEHQRPGTQMREAQWLYTEGVWELGSAIFLGMALFRFGFFDHRFSAKKYGLLALTGLITGLFLGWLRLHYHQLALQDYEKYIRHYPLPYHFFFPLEILVTAMGYASLMLLLLQNRFLTPVWRVLAKAGQMALTNYLLQSIICVLFFDGIGMGYFARLQQWQLYVFAAEIILVNTVFSVVWLRYFHYGPAEWLWRCLIYKKWLPNRKDLSANEPALAVS